MLEPLPNYDNWKTEPEDADDFDGYDAGLDDLDRRHDEAQLRAAGFDD